MWWIFPMNYKRLKIRPNFHLTQGSFSYLSTQKVMNTPLKKKENEIKIKNRSFLKIFFTFVIILWITYDEL